MKQKFSFLVLSLVVFNTFSFLALAETVKYGFNLGGNTRNSYEVESGEKVEGSLTVTLNEDVDASFLVSFSSAFGDKIAGEAAASLLNMSNWIEFPEGKEVFVEGSKPGVQNLSIPFVVTIPEKIAPGDYVGTFKLQLNNVENEEGASGGAGVKFTTAIGIKVRFSIPGNRVHSLEILDLKLGKMTPNEKIPDFNDLSLILTYKNLGNSFVNTKADVKVKNWTGDLIIEETVNLGSVSPANKEVDRNFTVKEVPVKKGWLDVETTFEYQPVGADNKLGAEEYPAGKATLRIYVIPWSFVAGFVGLLLVLLMYFNYRYYRVLHLRENSKLYTVKQGDTLQDVCTRFSVDPKEVVYVNKFKSPYFLQPGAKIYIPNKK